MHACIGVLVAKRDIMSDEQKDNAMEELHIATKPLMDYLTKHHHPHVTVIVTANHAELMEGLMTAKN
jgi:ABC-type phosphate/phosphonate transport system substrate-binding protein